MKDNEPIAMSQDGRMGRFTLYKDAPDSKDCRSCAFYSKEKSKEKCIKPMEAMSCIGGLFIIVPFEELTPEQQVESVTRRLMR